MPNFKKGNSFAQGFSKKTPFRAGKESILGRFMAMGRSLGNSKTSANADNAFASVDPSKYYTAPKKKESEIEEEPIIPTTKPKAKKIARTASVMVNGKLANVPWNERFNYSAIGTVKKKTGKKNKKK